MHFLSNSTTSTDGDDIHRRIAAATELARCLIHATYTKPRVSISHATNVDHLALLDTTTS